MLEPDIVSKIVNGSSAVRIARLVEYIVLHHNNQCAASLRNYCTATQQHGRD